MYLPGDAEDMSTMLEDATATRILKLISPFPSVRQFGNSRFFKARYWTRLFRFQPTGTQSADLDRRVRYFFNAIVVDFWRAQLKGQINRAPKPPDSDRDTIP